MSRARGEHCPFIWHFPLIFHNRLLVSPDIRPLLIMQLPLMELLESPQARSWISCLTVRIYFFIKLKSTPFLVEVKKAPKSHGKGLNISHLKKGELNVCGDT